MTVRDQAVTVMLRFINIHATGINIGSKLRARLSTPVHKMALQVEMGLGLFNFLLFNFSVTSVTL